MKRKKNRKALPREQAGSWTNGSILPKKAGWYEREYLDRGMEFMDYYANPVDGWWCGNRPDKGGCRAAEQNLRWRKNEGWRDS